MKKAAACLVLLLTFAVYLYTLVPSVTEDDSGELASAAATLGTAHSPGYPLYCMAGKAAVTIVPWGNAAYRVNLVSALTIAAANMLLFMALCAIAGSAALAFVTSLMFGFSASVWAMANVTEVYGVAALCAAFIAWLLARDPRDGTVREYYALAFISGLGLTAHYTLGLLLPGLLWWAYTKRGTGGNTRMALRGLRGALWFCLGVSAVAYLYLRARQQPVFGWEDPQTPGRFWQVVARLRYGTAALTQGAAPSLSPSLIFAKLRFYLEAFGRNFTVPGLLLLVLGAFAAFRERKRGWPFLLLVLASGPGFLVLANVGLDPASRELLERFFFLSFLFAAVLIAWGLAALPKKAALLSAVVPAFLLFSNLPELNRRGEYLYLDYGRNLLKTAPVNTLLFSDRADEMEFVLGYLHGTEGRRKDLDFVDCNAGITRSIYGSGYYRIWGKPRLAIRERTERDIIEKSRRPVYYATFFPDMIALPRRQEGLLFRAKPAATAGREFPYEEIYALRVPEHIPDRREESLVLSYYQLLGDYYLGWNDTGRAEKAFTAVTLNDPTGQAFATIAYRYQQKGHLNLAEKYYQKAMESGSGGDAVMANLGAVYEARGESGKAADLYQRAIAANPGNEQAHYNLAVMYWKQGQWDSVVREFRQVLDINPSNERARAYLQMAQQRLPRQ